MTPEEYLLKERELLDGLPKEFADFLRGQAWDRGHSAGDSEVINVLQSMAYDFERYAWGPYKERIAKEGNQC